MQVKYEKKRLELLVGEAKLIQAEGSTNAQITKLRKALASTYYQVSMGEEKVRSIIKGHKLKTLFLSDKLNIGYASRSVTQ